MNHIYIVKIEKRSLDLHTSANLYRPMLDDYFKAGRSPYASKSSNDTLETDTIRYKYFIHIVE